MKRTTLKINGVQKDFVVDEKFVLLDLLRKVLGVTGAKQSCDRKGQCGACTVIVNGKAVRSCLTKVVDLEGADVITIEGLGTPDNPHLIQEAFVLTGAVQCGFCTPGMIMAAKALLDENNDPSVHDIKKALRRNLCRCTGYNRIIEAIQLAARFLRGETTPDKVRPSSSDKAIGVSHPRPWSLMKACGVAKYTDDIFVQGALEVAVVRSPHFAANIKSIDYADAEKMHGVVGVITAKDIKGTNDIGIAMKDQPILCTDSAPVLGAPIAAVVATTREQALTAAAAVRVDYEVLPRIATPEQALAKGARQVNPKVSKLFDPEFPNLVDRQIAIKGDAEKAIASSRYVIKEKFSTQLVHQAPLEPEAAIAYLDGEGEDAQLVIIGRSIWIHYHTRILQESLGYPNIRYIEAFTGGQFGIKLDITSEGIAAAAALHFKRPVKYIPSLAESMLMAPKRHPYSMDVELGADENGKLTGFCIDFTVENGAYTAGGVWIPKRSLRMLNSCYNIPHVKGVGILVYTNDAWGSAARGAGPPQTQFALELAMDMLAEKIKMDPFEFRLKNILRPGECTSTGLVVEEWQALGCFERMRPLYEKACKEAKKKNSDVLRKGVGVAGCSFGIGAAGNRSNVAVELDPDGGLTVYGSVADPGEGNDAMLVQIAAQCMQLPLDKIRLVTRDSEATPDSGESAGSRQTYVSGSALIQAIEMLKASMKEVGAKTHADLVKAGKPTRYLAANILPQKGLNANFQGHYWASRVHGAQMAEVEVNTETGEVKVLKMWAAVDAGTIINPLAVIGQIEGGMDMGAGYALREHYVLGKSKDWVTFKFPTIGMSFPMETILLETPRKNGPLGATGVGEFTACATHPAIANAVAHAIGVRINDLPITPERVLSALGKK